MNVPFQSFRKRRMMTDLIFVFILEAVLVEPLISFFSGQNIIVLFVCLASWYFSSKIVGLYNDFRSKPFSIEFVVFCKSLALYALMLSSFFYLLYDQHHFSRLHLMYHCFLLFLFIPIQKVLIRIGAHKLRLKSEAMRKVLIVGSGNAGLDFYSNYVKNEKYGMQLTGFVDDEKNHSLNGHFLGATSEIARIISNHELDDIVVTLPLTKEKQIEDIVALGEKEGKRIRIIPNFQNLGSGNFQVDKIGMTSVITIRSFPLDQIDNKFYKRAFDIIFSLLVIIFILSWLVPIISLLIKLNSKGPVFFRQERWGLNNKSIICFKFRSMVAESKDVNEKGEYQQASKEDARITKIGKFLRKSNLDELPQFLNVLLGSMSVIGPRPHPVPLNIMSKETIDKYMMRHWMKPGITGWAQVNGFRGDTRASILMKKRVEHDLWYIENWTFWLDIQIIVQTIVNMVKGDKNAF